jgi:hypothetical protein
MTKDDLFKLYGEIRIGTNAVCAACCSEEARRGTPLGRPVSFWHVGDQFRSAPLRLVFVGKNAVSGKELRIRDGCHDASHRGAELYLERFSSYWTAIEKISCRALGISSGAALSSIAITNLIKCNQSDGQVRKDTTTPNMKHRCLNELGVVWSELKFLKPHCVVFFTGKDSSPTAGYDQYIDNFKFGDSHRDITDQQKTILVGAADIGWWHREFITDGKVALRCLRTAHPQGKRDEFCDLVADWVRFGKTPQ